VRGELFSQLAKSPSKTQTFIRSCFSAILIMRWLLIEDKINIA